MERNGLREYQASTPYEVLDTRREKVGPLNTPIIPQSGPMSGQDALQRIIQLLEDLPRRFWHEKRRQILTPGRDAQYMNVQSDGAVLVAVGATTSIVSVTLDEKHAGGLLGVGIAVNPGAAIPDISFFIRENGIINPGFNAVTFNGDTLSVPFPFKMELTQGRTVELVAQNTGAVAVNVTGSLLCFQELLIDWKDWGTSPASGI